MLLRRQKNELRICEIFIFTRFGSQILFDEHDKRADIIDFNEMNSSNLWQDVEPRMVHL